MIETALLADHPQAIPTLAGWFLAQWPEYFAGRTPADLAQDFRLEANRAGLPIRLVAFSDGELAGTITLRERAIWTLPEFQPGLGGLLVAEQFRSRGVGTELVRVGMKVAGEQGYERAYATTVSARGILERLGWKFVQEVVHGNECLLLYGCEFATVPPPPTSAPHP
jgi:RimJ/RimL family protein N-acetyltransferase